MNMICKKIHLTLEKTLTENGAVFKYPSHLPTLMGVESHLFQVLMNLVNNGIKFNKHKHPTVTLSIEDDHLGWIIQVTDNGIGIKDSDKEKLFTLFKRLNTQSEFPGTGIGLAICKRIIERNHGKITIHSAAIQGTIFRIYWPKPSLS